MTVSRAPAQETVEAEIRAIYEEYTLEETSVAMITDPENEYAWIQSSYTMPIEA